MKNNKSRLHRLVHGGARGFGAPRYKLNALKYGETTSEAKAFRAEIRLAIQHNKSFIKELGQTNRISISNYLLGVGGGSRVLI